MLIATQIGTYFLKLLIGPKQIKTKSHEINYLIHLYIPILQNTRGLFVLITFQLVYMIPPNFNLQPL